MRIMHEQCKKKMENQECLSDALQRHHTSRLERFKLEATLCKWLVQDGKRQDWILRFRRKIMRTSWLNRKEFEPQRVNKKHTKTTSRTEVTFPCRTVQHGAQTGFHTDQQWELQWTKSGTSGEWNNHVCVTWCSTQPVPLVGRTQNSLLPQLKRHISYRIQVQESHQKYYIHRIFHLRSFLPCKTLEHPWKSRSYTSSKSGMERRTLPELRLPHDILFDSEKDRWPNHTLTADASEGKTWNTCAKAHRRLQSWHRRMDRTELRSKERRWFYELPDSPDSCVHAPSSNESDGWSVHWSSEPTCPIAPNRFINHNTIMDQGIMVSNRSTMTKSLATFWVVTVTGLVTPIRITQLAVAAFIQNDLFKRRHMDFTDSVVEHHDSHHIHSKQFISFLCCCRIFRCVG